MFRPRLSNNKIKWTIAWSGTWITNSRCKKWIQTLSSATQVVPHSRPIISWSTLEFILSSTKTWHKLRFHPMKAKTVLLTNSSTRTPNEKAKTLAITCITVGTTEYRRTSMANHQKNSLSWNIVMLLILRWGRVMMHQRLESNRPTSN